MDLLIDITLNLVIVRSVSIFLSQHRFEGKQDLQQGFKQTQA